MAIADELNKQSQERKIKNLLEEYPDLRDSDKRLCKKYWEDSLKGVCDINTISGMDFLDLYATRKKLLDSQESIGRTRRRLQEHNTDLRGTKYKNRKDHEGDVKDSLGY